MKTMHWQDLVFAVGSISFSIALLPMLRPGADRPPVFSSGLTSFWLISYGAVFLTLSLLFSAITSVINGILWGAIGYLKWREPRVRRKNARKLVESFRLEEAAIREQHLERWWGQA